MNKIFERNQSVLIYTYIHIYMCVTLSADGSLNLIHRLNFVVENN